MCVIVFVPSGVSIADSTLEMCYTKNPDGWGIMWVEESKVKSIKRVSTLEDFKCTWDSIKDKPGHKVIHFRIATHGFINNRNCHPFSVKTDTEEYKLMHNGVLSIPCINTELSDTWHYTKLLETVIAKYPDPFEDAGIENGILNALSGSKLAIMRANGTVYFYGTFQEHEGCKFSNLAWKPAPPRLYAPPKKSAQESASVFANPQDKSFWAEPDRCPKYTNPSATVCDGCLLMECLNTAPKPIMNSSPETFDECIDTLQMLIESEEYTEALLLIDAKSIKVKDLVSVIPYSDKWMPELLQTCIDLSL